MGTSYCPRRSKVFSDDEADVSGTVFSSGGAGLMVCGSRRRLKLYTRILETAGRPALEQVLVHLRDHTDQPHLIYCSLYW